MHIIIINWNNKKDILRCLESIKRSGYISDTVVVDNASSVGSVDDIKKAYPEIIIIQNRKNLGFAGGNNVGIKYALEKGSEYLFILNPDTIVSKKALDILHSRIKSDKKIGIIGPKILDKNKKIWSAGGIIDPHRFSGGLIGLGEKNQKKYEIGKEVDYISGTCMMVRREVFEKIGLFDEKYFIYYEDVELCIRTKKAGYKLLYEPKAVIVHNESSSFGKDSPSHQYYMARNHLLFVERNAPFIIKLRELIRLPKTLSEHKNKQEKKAIEGIKDYFLRRFNKYENRS